MHKAREICDLILKSDPNVSDKLLGRIAAYFAIIAIWKDKKELEIQEESLYQDLKKIVDSHRI